MCDYYIFNYCNYNYNDVLPVNEIIIIFTEILHDQIIWPDSR